MKYLVCLFCFFMFLGSSMYAQNDRITLSQVEGLKLPNEMSCRAYSMYRIDFYEVTFPSVSPSYDQELFDAQTQALEEFVERFGKEGIDVVDYWVGHEMQPQGTWRSVYFCTPSKEKKVKEAFDIITR